MLVRDLWSQGPPMVIGSEARRTLPRESRERRWLVIAVGGGVERGQEATKQVGNRPSEARSVLSVDFRRKEKGQLSEFHQVHDQLLWKGFREMRWRWEKFWWALWEEGQARGKALSQGIRRPGWTCLLLTSEEALDKHLNCSRPQFPHL